MLPAMLDCRHFNFELSLESEMSPIKYFFVGLHELEAYLLKVTQRKSQYLAVGLLGGHHCELPLYLVLVELPIFMDAQLL